MKLRVAPALLTVAALVLATSCNSKSKDTADAASPSPSAKPTATSTTRVTTGASPEATTNKPPHFVVTPLQWVGCGGGFQCSTLKVPLDYTHPLGSTISIAVIRHHVKNSKGSLVINPGGPGASGIEAVRYGLPRVGRIQSNLDIVGFDPRGTGASTNVNCGHHLDDFVSTDSSPDSQAEINQLKAVSTSLAQECLTNGGRGLLTHVTTKDAARDMDLLRQALGEAKLDYLGFSYGTMLGAIYLELFPQNAGRIVLDGVLDPKLTAKDIEVQQSIAFEKSLDDLLAQCAASKGCAFTKGSSPTLQAEYDRLAASVDATPLATGTSRKLTQALFFLGVAAGLYDKNAWDDIEEALHQAQKGNGYNLLSLSDSYDERGSNGYYPTTLAAMYAVNCTDRPIDGGLAGLTKTANDIKKQAPRMGPAIVWLDMPCVVWKVAPLDKAHTVAVPGYVGAHTLIVGTTRDPATPYVNAQSLHAQIKGSSLLTYDGDGHTAIGRGSSCVDNAVAKWLVDGQLPADGMRC